MHNIILESKNLHVAYGKKEILRGIDFSLRTGEVVTLLGANGSGKSSSLNAVAGLIRSSNGKVLFDKKDITAIDSSKIFNLGLVLVTQSRDLFLDMSVEDNLYLGALMRKKNNYMNARARVYEYFPRLKERRKQKARTMSGGEQQMLAIGRALMSEPKLILLDEPSGGLSPQFVNEVAMIMKQLKEENISMLIVEQNLNLAFAASDRYIILHDGKISGGGKVTDLPQSREEIVKSIYL